MPRINSLSLETATQQLEDPALALEDGTYIEPFERKGRKARPDGPRRLPARYKSASTRHIKPFISISAHLTENLTGKRILQGHLKPGVRAQIVKADCAYDRLMEDVHDIALAAVAVEGIKKRLA